jgi:hypothetical protein
LVEAKKTGVAQRDGRRWDSAYRRVYSLRLKAWVASSHACMSAVGPTGRGSELLTASIT